MFVSGKTCTAAIGLVAVFDCPSARRLLMKINAPAACNKFLGLNRHSFCESFLFCKTLLRCVLRHVLRDLHRAKVWPTHRTFSFAEATARQEIARFCAVFNKLTQGIATSSIGIPKAFPEIISPGLRQRG